MTESSSAGHATARIDPDVLIGAPLPSVSSTWSERDVIIYHLGLGAGVPPSSPSELRYVYERDLTVLPSFASVAGARCFGGFRRVQGLNLENVVVLHAEHRVEVPAPIPTNADVVHTGYLKDLIDRGAGALALFEVETRDRASNRLLMRNLASFYLKGFGGFGNQASEPYQRISIPTREPDHLTAVAILPQQAFIYRLSGDVNPLHVDPEVATRAGFPQPLLHGLCTYGIACKVIVDTIGVQNGAAISDYRARFAGPVFPGETLEAKLWLDDTQVVVDVATTERRESVLIGSATLQ
jgi:acyl dehydratase